MPSVEKWWEDSIGAEDESHGPCSNLISLECMWTFTSLANQIVDHRWTFTRGSIASCSSTEKLVSCNRVAVL